MARIVESIKEPRASKFDLVELKGARITDLLEQFFRKEFWVESSMCSVKGSAAVVPFLL